MGRRRRVDTHFWNDTFIAELEKDQKLLFAYLITSPLGNMLGVYEIHPKRISFDTGIDRDTITQGLKTFERAGKAKYKDGYIILTNFVKNQNYNKNMKKSAAKVVHDLPEKILHDPFFVKLWKQFRKLSDTDEIIEQYDISIINGSEPFPNGSKGQREGSETAKNNDKDLFGENARTRGVPIPEVLQSNDFKEVIEKYWNHLESTFRRAPSLQMVDGKMKRLLELQQQGHDPVKVVQQTINDGNKKFYAITDKQFESKGKNNGKSKEVDLNAIDEETSEVFEGRRQANEL